jgi:hypothetical protein
MNATELRSEIKSLGDAAAMLLQRAAELRREAEKLRQETDAPVVLTREEWAAIADAGHDYATWYKLRLYARQRATGDPA